MSPSSDTRNKLRVTTGVPETSRHPDEQGSGVSKNSRTKTNNTEKLWCGKIVEQSTVKTKSTPWSSGWEEITRSLVLWSFGTDDRDRDLKCSRRTFVEARTLPKTLPLLRLLH